MSEEHEVSIEGNGFITKYGEGDAHEMISKFGIENWRNPGTLWSVYFYVEEAGDLIIRGKFRGPLNYLSVIRVGLEGSSQFYDIPIEGDEEQELLIGLFRIESPLSYVQLNFQGISRTGPFYTDITSILFNHPGQVWYIRDDIYFGRRGPSVHLRYLQNPEKSIEYFYNEVLVPSGNDIEGAYYAAAGFNGGYFGIQVNGQRERRILFSIWSEFDTEDPDQIPEEYKVVPLKNGRNVHVGEFGNEGSGAQSFLRFPWSVGSVYKFLIKIVPIDSDNTEYTSWILMPENEPNDWQFKLYEFFIMLFNYYMYIKICRQLISSFRKPKVSLNVQGLYCFSENFIPEQGHLERQVLFGNHWTCDSDGVWDEITQVTFTADATSRLSRKDISGGLNTLSGDFYLRNCGFFSDRVEAGEIFNREPRGIPPQIDFGNLP